MKIWYKMMVKKDGMKRWYKMMVKKDGDGDKIWYETMV
jgi:hypothetical protein